MLAERRNSPSSGRPSTSSRTVWVRLPCATAAMARVTSFVGRSRSSTRVLTETSISPQAPLGVAARGFARASCPPCRPPARRACSSLAICSLAATISLKVSAIFPARPVQEPGRRTEKSPSRIVCRLASMTARSGDTGSAARLERPLFFEFFSTEFMLRPAASRSLLFTIASKRGNICK